MPSRQMRHIQSPLELTELVSPPEFFRAARHQQQTLHAAGLDLDQPLPGQLDVMMPRPAIHLPAARPLFPADNLRPAFNLDSILAAAARSLSPEFAFGKLTAAPARRGNRIHVELPQKSVAD